MEGYINGKDLNIYYQIAGVSYPAAYATDCTISLIADVQETTTKNTKKGKTFDYQGKYSYTLTLKGVTNLVDRANFGTFQDAIMLSNKLLFVFTDNNSVQWSGTVLIKQIDIDSPFSAVSTFNNAMQGDGELVKVTTIQPPTPPPVASVVIQDQLGNTVAIVNAPGIYPVLKFDSIDLGGAVQPTPQITISV